MFEIKDGYIYIKIKAQPNSSKNKIAGKYGESLKVNIKAPAVEGAANKELIKFIGKEFKIPKSEIAIKGETSKQKVLIVPFRDDIIKKLEEINGH
ncbi:conserved hypothetical protein [Nautilia profundicola AmH]|uniref:UPF0235 protein NAMH_1451 n=1 Tax=Nautilia profundicola (strain ATCC BAA-1463 / DSM 18972 / AmH) TaxID=598659 RepID=B9L655_NAUPA|nr:DUF167 domain-containing protein [Nautilia profundicola]ACM93657.1 conserved hypothetical protein [Nautilia profundicola AmH]